MRRLLSVLGLVSVALLACSGSDATTAPAADPEAVCDDGASVYCATIDACSSFYLRAVFGDVARCKARVKIECVSRLGANGTSLTPAALEACVNAVRGSQGCTFLDSPPEACKTVAGSLQNGQACAVDDQCQGRNCRLATGSTCGACSTVSAAGGACESSNDCEEGLVCAGGVCATRGRKGDACSADKPCLSELVCNNGTCSDALEAGVSCTPKRPQDPPELDPCNRLKGLFCHPTRNVCTLVELVGPGQSCGFVNGTFVGCAGGATCKTSPGTLQGTCQAPAADGQSCDDANGPSCIPPARCKGGVCTLPDPNACK